MSGRKRTEVHGHRGCRGYLPENTIPAFIKAVALGVDALELDVVITGDNLVLVSHEAWFTSEICLKPDGSIIHASDELGHNIYRLPYSIIKQYDCGLKPNSRFPDQEKIPAVKPLLQDVIDAVEEYTTQNNLPPVNYNIEIKSLPSGDDVFHPHPKVFTKLLMEVLLTKDVISRTMIQSFDVRPLQELRSGFNNIQIGLLVNYYVPAEQHLDKLGFLPFAYNPHFSLLTPELVTYLRTKGIRIYTWTVNTFEIVQNIADFELNGIITDYPIMVRKTLESM